MTLTVTDYELPTKLSTSFDGCMKGIWKWHLEPREKSTHLSMEMEYEIAGGIVGKAMNAMLVDKLRLTDPGQFLVPEHTLPAHQFSKLYVLQLANQLDWVPVAKNCSC